MLTMNVEEKMLHQNFSLAWIHSFFQYIRYFIDVHMGYSNKRRQTLAMKTSNTVEFELHSLSAISLLIFSKV